MPRKAELTTLSSKFCYNYVYLSQTLADSYNNAGYAISKYASQTAEKLLKKPYVLAEIKRLKLIKAAEIIQKQANNEAELIITRERQTRELEEIKDIALNGSFPKDLPSAIACIREQNVIGGLRIEGVFDAGDTHTEIDEARRVAAAAIPDEYFLKSVDSTSSPQVEAKAIPQLPALRDAPGLKKSDEPDISIPPEQLPPVDSAQ